MSATDTTDLQPTLRAAVKAQRQLEAASAEQRRGVLRQLAARLRTDSARDRIATANEADLLRAKAEELAPELQARLGLSASKLETLAEGLDNLAAQPDLVGTRLAARELDDKLVLEQVRVPLGLIAVVFESRPDAFIQIVGLALASGNAVALKGGREALESLRALRAEVHGVLEDAGLSPELVCHLEDRAAFGALLNCAQEVELLIARGSGAFVNKVMSSTQIPVLGHAEGLCHIYLDEECNEPEVVAAIIEDAKCSYPAACNAVETLLWSPSARSHAALSATLRSLAAAGVELRADGETRAAFPDLSLDAATEEDWSTEWGRLCLSIRQVDGLDEAMRHIARYGSRHTEAVLTTSAAKANRFCGQVDAACTFHNCSTRFADGFRMGLGAEVGISTSKLHARGPVGVDGLFTTKWILRGNGQYSTQYGGSGRSFRWRELD